MNILILMKKEYFDLIKKGKKKYEYRFKFSDVTTLTNIYISNFEREIYEYIKIKNKI